MRAFWFGMAIVLLAGCTARESLEPAQGDSHRQDLAKSAGYEFEAPVRLTAGGEPIAVDAPGYACPTMADVDGDQRLDLVVGQFAGGKMRLYRNIAATGAEPEFAAGEWIMTGDEPATVPGVW